MARILVVGNVTVDIINLVESYPREDDEVRALHQERRRGGNGGNNAVVLARLGHAVHFASTLAAEPDAEVILADLATHRIDVSGVQTLPRGKVPTSYVTLSMATGSRTIVHVRDLPEYDAASFAQIDLAAFDWAHFEGRNPDQVRAMMGRLRRETPRIPISLEIEKPRRGIEDLMPLADLLLFSRGYALHHGFDSAVALLEEVHHRQPRTRLACGWGNEGAYAMGPDGTLHFAPATQPPRVVDTLGAGDVFNGAMIDGMVRHIPLPDALAAAARLAGRKCGQRGFDGLCTEDPA